jgi:hypothetical protein
MTWDQIFVIALPWIKQGAAGTAIVLLWMIRLKFKKLEKTQIRHGVLLGRLMKLHCLKYPKESFTLLDPSMPEENGAKK